MAKKILLNIDLSGEGVEFASLRVLDDGTMCIECSHGEVEIDTMTAREICVALQYGLGIVPVYVDVEK